MTNTSTPRSSIVRRCGVTAHLLGVLLASALVLTPFTVAVTPSVALATDTVAAPGDDGASFSNAELRSDAADPCIIKVGETYYLFATTSDLTIPYYTSYDLKNWTLAGSALSCSGFEGTDLKPGKYTAVWAPEVRERRVGGRTTYVLTYTAADYGNEKKRICVAEASHIAPGAFGRPKMIDTGSVVNAIDSSMFFEGNDIWVYFKNEDDYHSICVERLGSDWSRQSAPTTVLRMDQPWESWTIEGPWLLKWGSTYYLMYSSGGYTTSNYCVGYATSSSPEGPFTKVTTGAPLVRSQLGVVGPGHNTTLMIDEGEIYLVYHSLHEAGSADRRLMIDRMGIDADGHMFVNFSGFGHQPLPSGTKGYYQLDANDYSVMAQGVKAVELTDIVSGQSDAVAVATVDASSLTIEVVDGYHVADLWLFGTASGLSGTADLTINGSLVASGYQLSGTSTKLTLPTTNDYVKTIDVKLSASQRLSEVLLVVQGKRWGTSVYRMYNKATSEHLYTTNIAEYGMCGTASYADWQAEGVAWQAPTTSGNPVYRLYNAGLGDHHYTASAVERDALVAQHGWTYEGIAFYSTDEGGVPIYRLYNGGLSRGQHHYTASAVERDALVANYGWTNENIGFYSLD